MVSLHHGEGTLGSEELSCFGVPFVLQLIGAHSLRLQEATSTVSSFLFQIKCLVTHLRTKIWAVLFLTDAGAEVVAS